MAWILGQAPLIKDDETHAIFGNIQVQNVKGQITDSQADHTENTAHLTIKVKCSKLCLMMKLLQLNIFSL